MAFAATHTLAGFNEPKASPAAAAKSAVAKPVLSSGASVSGQGFFARLGAAFMQSRQRAAEREIARHRHLFDRMQASSLAAGDLPFTRN